MPYLNRIEAIADFDDGDVTRLIENGPAPSPRSLLRPPTPDLRVR